MNTLILLVLVGVAAADFAPLLRVDDSPKGRYLIKFKDDVDVDTVADGIQSHVQQQRLGQSKISHRYHHVLKGMAAELSDEALEYIRTLDEVEYVSEDGVAHATAQPWGLDRIGQRNLPLDGSFSTNSAYKQGAGVRIYVLDTGVRSTHNDFGGRATAAYDAYGGNGQDCQGHGTHCAGIAAGSYYGVAKKATIMGVKVLGTPACTGSGSYSAIVAGLDYVVNYGQKPGVVSMSLGGPKSTYMENALKNVVSNGYPVVVAAGNDNSNACYTSPAWLSEAITVGSTDTYDYRSSFSNYGSCVDIFAPGSNIQSDYYTSDSATVVMSGTSMACPAVAGISALYLAQSSGLSPSQIKSKLTSEATSNVIYYVGSGSPNLLAYVSP
ncbi:aqualysin-1-like [Patiria miniata]|uniref:Subtilisin n=1 Tax=Patiria miniata TaxID=46514 RepID=A0A914BF79_PATMI|nr:aqualysin-1-like [Patiria miniata]